MTAEFAPPIRVQLIRPDDVDRQGQFVLYWMTAFRRATWNFSLQQAAAWAVRLNKPLVVFEALRCDYPWASDRLHRFVIEGMADNAEAFSKRRLTYYPFVEQEPSEGSGLLAELSRHAAVVVTDDYPCFFLPALVRAAARQIEGRLEVVDSNGLLPIHRADRVFQRAVDFRRYLQRQLPADWDAVPAPDPLRRIPLPTIAELPPRIRRRWPPADVVGLSKRWDWLAKLPIDHSVGAAPIAGGMKAARRALRKFVQQKLSSYADDRSQPDRDVASGLSPYLHFGHVSAHEVFDTVMRHAGWTRPPKAPKATGSKTDWWQASPEVESFLDELLVWRELGFNFCVQRRDYDRYESLPDWAQKTLAAHARDRRSHEYGLSEFEQADTHDPLWNAAQRQLVREGRIHNYLRMLWGKKILEWSVSPQAALATMIELNNKYALDGRDPNSYSGIFWVLGRYDRPWAPERPVFGRVRYMSSENTARKLRVKEYLSQFGP